MKYSKKKIAITIFILCIFWVLAKSFHLPYDDNNPPPPPITMPFAEHKAGETIAFKVRINEPHSYSFFLCFRYREGDQADRARVDKLTGWFRTDKSGRLIEPGIPIPLRLTVFKVDTDGQHLFFTKEISEFPVSSWRSGSVDKKIASVFLETGQYAIRVESLQDVPKLQDAKIDFDFARTYQGK